MHLFEIYSEEAQEIIKTLSKDTVNALASLYLEKIALPIETLKDTKLLEDGKITGDEFLSRAIAREKLP